MVNVIRANGFPMRVSDSSMGGEAGQFHTTRWTLVRASARDQNQTGREALATLCQIYWYPLYAFARRRGYAQHDAQDLTQGFFLHLLERQALGRADPLRGKFRSFLLASFQNYLADAAEMARSLKRGGNCEIIFLDAQDAESRYALEPTDNLTAENIFEARWAITLLTQAADRLRAESVALGEASRFEVLSPFVGVAEGQAAPPSYEQVAKSLGIGVGAAKTLIHRFRKRYGAILRETIASTVSDPAEIEVEVHALCAALAVAQG